MFLLHHQLKRSSGLKNSTVCVYLWSVSVISQRIMLLSNVISSLKPNCSILCWHIFQRPGQPRGWIPWYSTKYFATFKKWRWITDRCKKSLFHRHRPIILGCDLLVSCFVLEPHSALKPQNFIRHQWELGGSLLWLFPKCACFRKWCPGSDMRTIDAVMPHGWGLRHETLLWRRFRPSVLLRATNLFHGLQEINF